MSRNKIMKITVITVIFAGKVRQALFDTPCIRFMRKADANISARLVDRSCIFDLLIFDLCRLCRRSSKTKDRTLLGEKMLEVVTSDMDRSQRFDSV